ncbi:type II toxin-antitoxin system Phd/YefM family antitoxin [Candidatus Peregrinibacteria bacterium]|jgi:prevent-host-death family protein|nr:type II toxin-antitoxin system Phd/YefM family antitoxin [Candidatus Peregrinibacteria bacterium]
MQVVQAAYAKNQFGKVLNNSQYEPCIIERYGQEYAAVISKREYDRLKAIEDTLLNMQAKQAQKEGFIGKEKSEEFLDSLLDAA